jgi:hypothetical protein
MPPFSGFLYMLLSSPYAQNIPGHHITSEMALSSRDAIYFLWHKKGTVNPVRNYAQSHEGKLGSRGVTPPIETKFVSLNVIHVILREVKCWISYFVDLLSKLSFYLGYEHYTAVVIPSDTVFISK